MVSPDFSSIAELLNLDKSSGERTIDSAEDGTDVAGRKIKQDLVW
jgi:hypothetical protein